MSARANQKLERGRVETLLERYAKPLAEHVPRAVEELERAWTFLLWNGAHDSACGCSHDQVAADVDARHAEARAIAEGIVERGPKLPPLPWEFERFGLGGVEWSNEDGEPVELQAMPEGCDADGLSLGFFDEPDVGDLYNFSWAGKG